MLADENVQAVVISSPHWLHAPLAVQAARAGKHVLTEKPLACTLKQADEMIAAAKAAGVQLGVLMPQRLTFPWTKARELIAAGAIGQIHNAKIHFMANKPATYWHGGFTGRAKDDWRLSMDKSGGGVTVMNLVHDMDSMSSVLDLRPKRVYAEYATLATPGEVEDFISVVMALENGAVFSMDASSAAVGGESHGDRIYGSKGQLHDGVGQHPGLPGRAAQGHRGGQVGRVQAAGGLGEHAAGGGGQLRPGDPGRPATCRWMACRAGGSWRSSAGHTCRCSGASRRGFR